MRVKFTARFNAFTAVTFNGKVIAKVFELKRNDPVKIQLGTCSSRT